jgi:hypothetical protein
VPGRLHHLQAQLAHDDRLAVLDPQIHERSDAAPVHHDGQAELAGERARGREVIGVGVRVDDIPEAKPLLGGQRQVAIDLVELGIHHQRGARLLAADYI